jgi:hypothetical protein
MEEKWQETNLSSTLKRKEIPVRLAFSITFNKFQGQSFNKFGIHLSRWAFTHRKFYFAFSTVRAADSVKVKLLLTIVQVQFAKHEGFFSNNAVYTEVLC